MAIEVKVVCSDCGTVVDETLNAADKEILCPECRRNMPNLPREEFRQIEKTLSTQLILGLFALAFFAGAGVLIYLYAGEPKTWVSSDLPRTDTSTYLMGAGGCVLIGLVLGVLSSRKRYVIEI